MVIMHVRGKGIKRKRNMCRMNVDIERQIPLDTMIEKKKERDQVFNLYPHP